MPSYFDLLMLITPVFALIGIGAGARLADWIKPEADESLLKLVVNVLYPAFIFRSVLGNEALADPRNVVWPPLIGFFGLAAAMLFALWVGRLAGLKPGKERRTFAFSSAIFNYTYVPIPLMTVLFGAESVGVLLVHNVGYEAAIWTVGIMVVSGHSLGDGGWRKLISGPVIALVAAGLGNWVGLDQVMPPVLDRIIELAAVCAIPIGLITIGATVSEYLGQPRQLLSLRVMGFAALLRLAVFPLILLGMAALLPLSPEMRWVLLVQAAMPAGIIPILIAHHYGGRALTGVQVVVATTVISLVTTPLWLRLGLAWLE